MNYLSLRRSYLSALVIGFFACGLHAQTNSSAPWNTAPFSAYAKEMGAAAAAIKPKQYAKVTIFTDERRVVFDTDGKYTLTTRSVYRIETKEAFKRWGTVKATWSPWRSSRPQIRARVIAPDGSVVMLDPKVLTEAPVHDQRPEIYEDVRSYSGPLPSIEIGSIVEDEMVWADSLPPNSHGGIWRYYLGSEGPVLHSLLELRAPTSAVPKYKIRKAPSVEVTRNEQNGVATLRFEQGSMDALEPTEGDLPADFDRWAMIEYATGDSWNTVAKGYYSDIESAIRPADVGALLEGTTNLKGLELMRRLVTNLHQRVRYTGLEFGSSRLIPHPAGDTLKSGYGDCKDKAVVLVSALQAAGIPAQLALLNTRGGDDVNTDLAGLGIFDHAIVYVPGKPAIWIDATAEFFGPGELPWVDQGRLSLVVGRETKELLRIPINTPSENTQRVKREFHLSEYGPAQIVETFEGTGQESAILRSRYGQEETKETREALARYVKSALLAEDLTGTTHTSGSDLTKLFQLRLEIAKGKRGSSDFNSAVVAIRTDGIMWGYPDYVRTDDGTDKPEQPGWKPRKNDIEISPFASEWHFRIESPPGFGTPTLPKDVEQSIGPAKFTQHYSFEANGAVSGVLRFDSVKARYSPIELKALEQAAHTLGRADAIIISFPQKGASLLAQGKAREALASYADLIKLHPDEALHHIQMANALLAAGFGGEARKEASHATELDPNNAVGWSARGWILEHDAIGRRFGTGFDLKGAAAAYRKAIDLDSKTWTNYANLAILLEHDVRGERYSANSDLDGAAAEYRALKQVDKENGEQYDDNLLFVLFYKRKWDEVLQLCNSLPSSATRAGIALATTAARDGSQATLTEAIRRSANEGSRSDLLVSAANLLIRLRIYPRALELLDAAAAGQADSSKLRKRIELLHAVRPYEEVLLPENDPRRVVQQLFLDLLDPNAAPEDLFRYLEVDPADQKAEALDSARGARLLRRSFDSDETPAVMAPDLLISTLQMSVDGDEQSGFRIRAKLGDIPQTALIARRSGGYRIVVLDDVSTAGREVLRRLSTNDLKAAKRWLDWEREEVTLNSGDDPLGGAIFPRFWTRGDEPEPTRMKLAALALLADKSAIREHMDFLKEMRAQAKDSDAVRLDLLLAHAATATKDWKLLREVAARLFSSGPASDTALRFVVSAATFEKDWDSGQKAISSRLARIPDDIAAIRATAQLAEGRGDFAQARSILRPLIDKNRAEMNDLNQYTWNSLFLGKVSDDDLSIMQRAVNENSSYPEIHTLACLYAEIGKTKEARELLLRAMDSVGMDEPNEPIWYGFGRIAEDYGLQAVALSLYQRVGKTEDTDIPSSTYNLARLREKTLQSVNSAAAVGRQ